MLFAVTLFVVGAVVRERLQATLENDAQANAEQVLEGFLASGLPSSAATEITRFVFFDEFGNEITPEEFERQINETVSLAPPDYVVDGAIVASGPDVLPPMIFNSMGAVEVTGVPQVIEFDPGAVVLASPISVGSLDLAVGVSSPRGPIEDVIRTTTIAGAILIPFLTAIVAMTTWMTTSRALRSVEAIRQQVELTHLGRLDVRVPKTGTSDEIDRLAGTMNDMLDRLDRAAEQQRQFISDASHELRSPITATLATIETLDVQSSQEWDEVAALIAREQGRLAGLVDDLLLLAQLDEADTNVLGDVDLDDLALVEAQRAHPCAVTVEIVEPCRVLGNERLLRRCVSNLVDNATRHANSHVGISVGTTVRGEARIRVDDDGPGVPRDRRDEIFERFTRLDQARRSGDGGAGLGLAIARNIAEQHDAWLVVTDSPRGGARFEIRFATS